LANDGVFRDQVAATSLQSGGTFIGTFTEQVTDDNGAMGNVAPF
jgi:hypothetical protein